MGGALSLRSPSQIFLGPYAARVITQTEREREREREGERERTEEIVRYRKEH